ncbi:MAG: CBS domain-containing protein [Candidatus Omnitrophota bacterium]|nr:CBS domain-containing protein [Candidatus Omnitrophota bacterium]
MTSPAVTVHVTEEFSAVHEKFLIKGIRHLPVVDGQGRIQGLVTETDFNRVTMPRMTEDGPVYDKTALDRTLLRRVMTPEPCTLCPDDPLSKAVSLMAEHKYGCIPIVDVQGKVIGIVTEIDILKYIRKML